MVYICPLRLRYLLYVPTSVLLRTQEYVSVFCYVCADVVYYSGGLCMHNAYHCLVHDWLKIFPTLPATILLLRQSDRFCIFIAYLIFPMVSMCSNPILCSVEHRHRPIDLACSSCSWTAL